ncbi:MAG TPA: dephospho-CoA kinase [Thermoanaerobaculia bacterium]|nr:dephospho-CoA kinase [Thermoanaerobaculia bacterium]
MILKVGLTGGISSGKSTVAGTFREFGCTVVDADQLVGELYAPGRPGHIALRREYGDAILTDDERIDRRKLANIAFETPEQTARLNALIHPLVIAEEERIVRSLTGDQILVVEATLLLESGGRNRYDKVVVVDIDPILQIERAITRGMHPGDVRRRIAGQMRREERLAQADYVIENNGTLAKLAAAVWEVYTHLQEDLAKKKRPAEAGRPLPAND